MYDHSQLSRQHLDPLFTCIRTSHTIRIHEWSLKYLDTLPKFIHISFACVHYVHTHVWSFSLVATIFGPLCYINLCITFRHKHEYSLLTCRGDIWILLLRPHKRHTHADILYVNTHGRADYLQRYIYPFAASTHTVHSYVFHIYTRTWTFLLAAAIHRSNCFAKDIQACEEESLLPHHARRWKMKKIGSKRESMDRLTLDTKHQARRRIPHREMKPALAEKAVWQHVLTLQQIYWVAQVPWQQWNSHQIHEPAQPKRKQHIRPIAAMKSAPT